MKYLLLSLLLNGLLSLATGAYIKAIVAESEDKISRKISNIDNTDADELSELRFSTQVLTSRSDDLEEQVNILAHECDQNNDDIIDLIQTVRLMRDKR